MTLEVGVDPQVDGGPEPLRLSDAGDAKPA
jgi:hypothetical protein